MLGIEMKLSRKDFEKLVEAALAGIPADFRDEMVNVEIEVKARPGREARGLGTDLLGLYFGPTRDEMLSPLNVPEPPGRIVLYQENLEDECADMKELRREVSLTLRHEIAHHLGIDDDRLEEVWPEGA
ncbi:MAG: metallopeptidase family protein [Pseudomonadota bacterium]